MHPLRQLFEKRIKKKIKGQDTRAIELFVEQPKPLHESRFLRAVTSSQGQDACAGRGRGAAREEDASAAQDGGGRHFGSKALQLYFARHSSTRHAVGRGKCSKSSVLAKRRAQHGVKEAVAGEVAVRGTVKKIGGGVRKMGKPPRSNASRESVGGALAHSTPLDKSTVRRKLKKVSAEV